MKLSPRYFLFALVCLLVAASAHAQTYTSDNTLSDFTNKVTTYATLSQFNDESCQYGCDTASPYTPTNMTLGQGLRVYGGTLAGAGLAPTITLSDGVTVVANNWIMASFAEPVSSIIVFPNIDHYGSPWDGYQYSIAGSNDGVNWTPLFDALTVTGGGEPFTLGASSGTPPTTVNNVLSPGAGPNGTVGYIAQFTFAPATYQYYAFGASTFAANAGNADQELSAVGTMQVFTRSTSLSIPTSGALLTINGSAGGTAVNIYRYDSQIHSGTYAPLPVGTDLSNCNSTDAMYPTDAYVLQGGSWTGCDAGDGFETTDNNIFGVASQSVGTTDVGLDNNQTTFKSGFHIETHYSSSGYVQVTNYTGQNFTGTITLSGNPQIALAPTPTCPITPSYPSVNTPFITAGGATLAIQNYSAGPLESGSSAMLTIPGDSSSCGGFNAPQIALMINGRQFQYNIGKDYLQFTPFDSKSTATIKDGVVTLGGSPEYLKVLPVPVPAGPLGAIFGNGAAPNQFGPVELVGGPSNSNFTTLPLGYAANPLPAGQACAPIASFSGGILSGATWTNGVPSGGTYVGRDSANAGATLNPACPELELDCVTISAQGGVPSPCGGSPATGGLNQFLWEGFLGFTVDPIVGAGIGGVHILAQHNGSPAGYAGTCPTNGFNTYGTDSLLYYIGDSPGIDFPSKNQSCFLTTYEPAAPVTANKAVAYNGFNGRFAAPVVNCPTAVPPMPQPPCTPQLVKAGSSIPLQWLSLKTDGSPVIGLSLCTSNTQPTPPTCAGASAPWVWMGYSQIVGVGGALIGNVLDDTAGASGLQYLGGLPNPAGGVYPPGTYQFNWKTSSTFKPNSFTPVMVFSQGTIAFDVAEFTFF